MVEEDPTEQGIRAWLNFGHTIGHSVEKLKDFTLCHGECVAIGCAAAAWMSWKRGLISEKEKEAAEQLLLDYQLPVRVKGLKPEDIVRRIQAYFGEEYGLDFRSEYTKGTQVYITLPKKEEAAQNA